MNKQKIFVLSKLSNIVNLIKNELQNHLLSNVEVVDVLLHQDDKTNESNGTEIIGEKFYQQMAQAEVMLVDTILLPQILQTMNNDHNESSRLRNIRWIQSTFAGVELLLSVPNIADIVRRNGLMITRYSGAHFGHLMADYILGQMLCYERQFYLLHKHCHQDKFWPNVESWFSNVRRTDELHALILGGTGTIGSYVCKKLSQMGVHITAYGRTERSAEDLSRFYQEYQISKYSTDLKSLISDADYLISILPSTPFTNNLLGNGILSNCEKKKPVLINVGRGNVIDENEIIHALDQGWIRYAILDVFQTEPLSTESVLWSRDDVLITPHISAPTRASDLAQMFVQNYVNYQQNKPLDCMINFENEY